MNKEIYNRAYEMIANGYEFGQIQDNDTWEQLMQGGPYSDIYTCAEKLEEEYGIKIKMGLEYLKKAFERYNVAHWDDFEEMNESINMKKNTIKLNESQLRKVIAESVKKVLKEGKWDIRETMNMLGDIKLIARFLQNNYKSIDNSDDADAIHETVQKCLRELWHIAQQFGYC